MTTPDQKRVSKPAHNFGDRVLLGFLSLMLVLSTSTYMAPAAGAPEVADYEQELKKFEKLIDAARTGRAKIDRTAFDLEAVLDVTDYEAESIIEFVRNEIAFEQYPGVLRGPVGTLMSRAGNALDQSLLLAKLLRDAGYDARIARGTLTGDQADRLLSGLGRSAIASPAADTSEALTAFFRSAGIYDELDADLKSSLARGSSMDIETAPVLSEVRATYASLTRELEKAGAMPFADSASIREEAQEYFWVQISEEAAAGWVDVHPAFPGDPDINAETFYTESVPAELQHRFRFQVFIERSINGRLVSEPLTRAWERPTANLNGMPLTFTNIPEAMAGEPSLFFNPDKVLEQSGWFLPAFGRGMADGASYFDQRGMLVDPMAVSDPAAGIFKTIGSLFADVSNEFNEGSAPALTAQWLEFTLISPDGVERSYRRTTLDRIGMAARHSGEAIRIAAPTAKELRPLLQRHTFMLANGAVPAAMALDSTLENIVQSEPLIRMLFQQVDGQQSSTEDMERLLQDVPNHWSGHLSLYTRLDRSSDLSEDHVQYRSAPTLVVHRTGLDTGDRTLEAVDIVQNPRRSFAVEDSDVRLDPEDVLLSGIWDTFLEGSLLGDGDRRVSTVSIFHHAVKADAAIKVVTEPDELKGLEINPDSRIAMQNDLSSGAILVVADYERGGNSAWWRIHPETGETVGQIGDGRGSEMVEYLQGLALGLSVALLAVALLNCANDYDPETLADVDREQRSLACCGVLNIFLFAVSYLVGTLNWAAGAMRDSAFSFMPNLCDS